MTTTILDLRREWSGCRPLTYDELVGDFEASFAAPLRRVAPRGLGLIGLPRWYGKRFTAGTGTDEDQVRGINLVRDAGVGLREVLPMSVRVGTSLVDTSPAVVLTYAADAPRPWRWVRDELREAPDGTIIGMTFVDRPALRRVGTPFLLNRVAT